MQKKGFFIMLIIFSFKHYNSNGQNAHVSEFRKYQLDQKEEHRLDSLALAFGDFTYAAGLYLKTQFPVQHALGLQFKTSSGLSFIIGAGILSSSYMKVAMDLQYESDSVKNKRREFLKGRIKDGSDIELGVGYYHVNSGFFAYSTIQFQKFSLSGTPEEIVENLDFGAEINNRDDIQEVLDNSPVLEDFYYNEIVYPTIRPIQLVLSIGKNFYFKKLPRLSISTYRLYSLNLTTKVNVEANSRLGNIIMDSFVNPTLSNSSEQNFASFNLPAITLQLNYEFGKMIR